MPGMGNLFRSACQNLLKSVAKLFRVPTDSWCFPLKISVKSKKKGLHVRRCPTKKKKNLRAIIMLVSETSAAAFSLTRFRGLVRV